MSQAENSSAMFESLPDDAPPADSRDAHAQPEPEYAAPQPQSPTAEPATADPVHADPATADPATAGLPGSEHSPAASALDSLQVTIDFRVGEITLPVNALSRLAPGFTLTDLPGILFPRVQALSHGRVFAEGELVEIDGRIGFRILEILA